ncbi:hypothetical protein [Stenotrophomonas forensis]|uniref:hypothetical protein n=1 Tax=Stenotrophomonas forensis TaxID=2871169 RepID=UPI0039C671EB
MFETGRYIEKFKSLSKELKLYAVGLLPLAIGSFGPLLGMHAGWCLALLAVGCLCMAIGLLFRLVPLCRTVWEKPAVRRLVLLFHLGVLVVTAAVARNIMTSATGLPGQDFTLATSALALPLYPLVWLWFVVLVMGVTVVALQLVLGLVAIAQFLLSAHVPSVGRKVRSRIGGSLYASTMRMIGLAVLFVALTIPLHFSPSWKPSLERLGRWAAFYGDYQSAHRYPGIPLDARVLMHANGVYSTAHRQPRGEISIDVHYWRGPDSAASDPNAQSRIPTGADGGGP